MGVAVINPRDCLNNPSFPQNLPSSLPKIKVFTPPSTTNPKPNPNRRRPNHRPKRSPPRRQDGSSTTSTVKQQLNQPLIGQIKILKRGELLTDPPAPVKPDLVCTDRMGEKVSVEGLYAGSSMFVASPPPSSVPLPAFFTKKVVNDATSDLRRILRLDL